MANSPFSGMGSGEGATPLLSLYKQLYAALFSPLPTLSPPPHHYALVLEEKKAALYFDAD